MIQILTCESCHKTSAVTAKVNKADFPRKGTWLNWHCPNCDQPREWLIPSGQNVEDAVRQSRQSSPAYKRSKKRDDNYKKLQETSPEMRKWLLFGELVWWWREEAGISQLQAAATAGITPRHWNRIEAGESRLRDKNIEKVVRAVEGHMEQAFLLLKPGVRWREKFELRLFRAEKQIKSPYFQKLHKEEVLSSGELRELDIALRELGRVLTIESMEERFLFYALIVHQTYWNCFLGGPRIIDDHKIVLTPLIKRFIDAIKKTERRANQYGIVNLIMLEAEYFMSQPHLLDLVTKFILDSFTGVLRREEVWNDLIKDYGPFSPQEKLVLALFDSVDPDRQSHLLRACKQIHTNAKREATKNKMKSSH